MSKNRIHLSKGDRVRKTLLRISDRIDRFCGTTSPNVPPKALWFQYGTGSFQEVGLEFFRILLDHCGLQRDSNILDIGSGVGRIAAPLRYFLKPPGSYVGADIMPEGIDYCTANVTPNFPNFTFERLDVYNSYYNPEGTVAPEEYSFRYPDGSFDLIISTSLMTHLRPEAAARYVAETARMLRAGGCSMHTFFVVDELAEKHIAEGKTALVMPHRVDNFFTANPDYVEAALGIPLALVSKMYADAGLEMEIRYGTWAQHENPLSFQDVVIGRKPR